MANNFPAILSCASMSPAMALSGSAQGEAWRAGETANSLGTRTLLACLSVRFLRIATERFGSEAHLWCRLESSVRSIEQMVTVTDRAQHSPRVQVSCTKIATMCSGWWCLTEFGDGNPAPLGSITCHLGLRCHQTCPRPLMEPF